jgi:solute carrier family 25 citrate transporter 1
MSMAPITASQFGTNRFMQQMLLGKPDGELTGPQKFLAAAVAGGVSGLIASPTELIIIQQQVCREYDQLSTLWQGCMLA